MVNLLLFPGAPGWEKFLGGNTSTIQFTTEEVFKFRQHKPQPKEPLPVPPKPPPKPKVSIDSNNSLGLSPIHACKSSPSLNQGHLSPISHPSRPRAKPGRLWKNSLDSISNPGATTPPSNFTTSGLHPTRGFTTSARSGSREGSADLCTSVHQSSTVSHSHSNSDSGLSSLSGRTSTMSPISTMSTVSSVSSTSSSSSSSSRASLRSASIVSSCTIPLDEEEGELEEEENMNNARVGSIGPSPSGALERRNSVQLSVTEKTREDLDCEKLALEVLSQLRSPSNDERNRRLYSLFSKISFCLVKILILLTYFCFCLGSHANTKSSVDYMEGMFDSSDQEDLLIRPGEDTDKPSIQSVADENYR